jgi:hypothetical protein
MPGLSWLSVMRAPLPQDPRIILAYSPECVEGGFSEVRRAESLP